MSTPLSSETPYCTPAQFVNGADIRTVAQLLSDTGSPMTTAQVQASPVLFQLLAEASGWLESECFKGQRYTPTDLQSLQGNSAADLAAIVRGLTIFKLWERRPDLRMNLPTAAQVALKRLTDLKNGEAVFGILEAMEAGIESSVNESPRVVEGRYMVTQQAERFFGRRNNRYGYRNMNT